MFFDAYVPHDNFGLYSESIEALLQTRLDLSNRYVTGYGHMETVGKWPIVPKAMNSGIAEEGVFGVGY